MVVSQLERLDGPAAADCPACRIDYCGTGSFYNNDFLGFGGGHHVCFRYAMEMVGGSHRSDRHADTDHDCYGRVPKPAI